MIGIADLVTCNLSQSVMLVLCFRETFGVKMQVLIGQVAVSYPVGQSIIKKTVLALPMKNDGSLRYCSLMPFLWIPEVIVSARCLCHSILWPAQGMSLGVQNPGV